MKTKALRGMGQQKDGKGCKKHLHKRRNRIYRNYAKESMVKEKRKVHEPVVCEDLS
ncbi:hypothetical protein ACTFRP_19010 [Bacillus cereus group sp. MYBK234-1]|uniref:hypothetical protein n=1 Tax=unclassified Bacillus cereus group TaxID=2750818 RepID=UPI003F79CF53